MSQLANAARPYAKNFLRGWGNPEQSYLHTQRIRGDRYRYLWDLYQGTAFDDISAWAQYRRAFGLYRATRLIWSHVHQLVEFYATHIWSGSLANDGLTLPDGVPNAIPLAPDTDKTLAAAIGQLWLWWNFQETMEQIVRYTAALGEFFVEIKDDPERGKVMLDLLWPSYLKDIKLDEVGNVKWYCIEYRVQDAENKASTFTYRREVDSNTVTTYKDNKPFDYRKDPLPEWTQPYGEAPVVGSGDGLVVGDDDAGPTFSNPYGFAPAVLFRHIKTLGVRGEPAVWSTQAALDEANQLFAHLLDKAHVSLEAPIVVAGNVAPNSMQRALQAMYGAVKRTFTEDYSGDGPVSERESLNVLEGPAGTRVETIELKITEAAQALDRIIAAIERNCPEVTFYQQLRQMTQLTGPAAERLLGDVDRKVRARAAGYDRSLTRLLQMGVSVAAFRYHEAADGWAERNDEQEKFAPFDETSFDTGDLNFDIMPRNVVPTIARDVWELLQIKKNVLGDLIPARQLAIEGGYDESVAEEWEREQERRQEEAFQRQQELVQSAPPPGPPQTSRGAPPGGPQRGAPNQNRRSQQRNNLRRVG